MARNTFRFPTKEEANVYVDFLLVHIELSLSDRRRGEIWAFLGWTRYQWRMIGERGRRR